MAGIGLILLANVAFSFIDTGTKWLALFGLAALQLAFMRYLGHFVISTVLMLRSGLKSERFMCPQLGLVCLRGGLLMLSTCLNFIAIRYLPLPLTATILFSAPILICALSWPLLREPVGPVRWSAIAVGFVGILIAIRPFQESFHWAACFSLGAATSFALYSILTRKLAGQVPADTLQFYAGFLGTIVLLPFAILQWQSPQTPFQWTVLIGLGLFGWLGHQMLVHSMRFAPANLVMPFGYSFIVFLTIWSYFVFDELPDGWTLLGAAIVVSAGLFIWQREAKLKKHK